MRFVAVVMIVSAVFAACGDDDVTSRALDSDEQDVADAIVDFILDDGGLESMPVTEDDLRCIAERTVAAIGVDGLAEIGITASSVPEENPFEDAPDEHVDAFVDGYFDCVDVAAIFADATMSVGSVSTESAACVEDAMSGSEVLRPMLRVAVTGGDPSEDPELFSELLGVYLECLTPEELTGLSGG